jgi:thymidylate synthase
MGIDVTPRSMQDKKGEFKTKELQTYGFQVREPRRSDAIEHKVIEHIMPIDDIEACLLYVDQEHKDRINLAGPVNPGNSWRHRSKVWEQFLHYGVFSYTYSSRMWPQLRNTIEILKADPDSRQGVIAIYNAETDNLRRGGKQRVPCSMHYQFMVRNGKVDLLYTMRSCDFLVHFPIDLLLALRIQDWMAKQLGFEVGMFTYFTGSLHAYYEDIKARGIF